MSQIIGMLVSKVFVLFENSFDLICYVLQYSSLLHATIAGPLIAKKTGIAGQYLCQRTSDMEETIDAASVLHFGYTIHVK